MGDRARAGAADERLKKLKEKKRRLAEKEARAAKLAAGPKKRARGGVFIEGESKSVSPLNGPTH